MGYAPLFLWLPRPFLVFTSASGSYVDPLHKVIFTPPFAKTLQK
jgi:hypothetical protein